MFVIKINEGHREYVATSHPNWLNLLDGVTKKKKYATTFCTKKEAQEFADKLMMDGYEFSGDAVYGKFSVVKA